MYYDLNVPWSSDQVELKQRVSFLAELGYNVLVLTNVLPAKLSSNLTSPIQNSEDLSVTKRVRLLTRCTIPIASAANNPGPRINELRQQYDIIALRPVDEKTLLQAVTTLDTDIISLNLAIRYPFHFRPKTFSPALARGVKIELCYGGSVLGADSEQRRNVLMNAAEIVRSTRGRGIVISSEAANVLGCRAPHDVINLAGMWGLSKELGAEAIGNGARSVVAAAQLRKRSFRGAVDVVQVVTGDQVELKTGEQNPNDNEAEEQVPGLKTGNKSLTVPKHDQVKSQKKRTQRTSQGSMEIDSSSLTKRSKK